MTSVPPFADTITGVAVPVQIELAIMSQPGGRDHNEDACGHWHSGTHLCCVVADGAGGHGGGGIASKLAVRYVIERYAGAPVASPAELHRLILGANEQVIAERAAGTVKQDMHTTVVALFVDLQQGTARWAHAGDSRLYAFRAGRLALHTRDHSLVQSLVDAGMLEESGMRAHPQRSELLSALGTQPDDLLIGVSDEPWRLKAGDVFLLCTDGLWEYVDDAALEASVGEASDPHRWLAALESAVLRNAAQRPHHDNFSALTVWVRDADAIA